VATLSYAYALSTVVLEDLAPEAHPMVHDLCSLHAESVRVPRGWDLCDERRGATAAGDAGSLRLVGA
jgi:hypothetical protein